jgi:hypothetical protein
MGMIKAVFQMVGTTMSLTDKLKSSVRYITPDWPRFFKCKEVRPSGHMAVELLDLARGSVIIAIVKGMNSWLMG